MPEQVRTVHHLEGLQAQPLASYLTALAVLRLVHEQRDRTVSAAWCEGHFILDTELDREQLLQFFLEEYQPTPLTSPWNGGSGYYGGKSEKLDLIRNSSDSRFENYRVTIKTAGSCLQLLALDRKPDPSSDKPDLIKLLRCKLSDHALKWLDCCVVLADGRNGLQPAMAPLLGSGGNDGNFEFSLTFMQRLHDLFLCPRASLSRARTLLLATLFGHLTDGLTKDPIGQFSPGAAGGVNSTNGLEGKSQVNPWLYILALEGAIVLSASCVRRYGDSRSTGSFPFTVAHLPVGNGRLGREERGRQEIWLPLWENPCGYPELAGLFSEGRAQVGSQQARNPVEFSLALASHGTSRGLTGFSRYGFLQRNGKSFFATPLGYHPVKHQDSAGLLRRVERWFASYRHQLKKPESVGRAIRRYDTAVMEHLSSGGKRSLAEVLERLGELHMLLCRAPKLWDSVRPLPQLDQDWVALAYDGTPEFRLALALSTLGGEKREFRAQLCPYNPKTRQWNEIGFIPRWKGRDVPERMLGLLRHRLLVAHNPEESAPVWGSSPASRADIEDFIERRTDDARIERLLYALCLIPAGKHDLSRRTSSTFLTLPYLLPRLALHQGRPVRQQEQQAGDGRDRRVPPAHIVHLLMTGKVGPALKESRRFLLGRGLLIPTSLTAHQPLSPATCRRLAAALLFPISDRAYNQVALNILKLESDIARKEREDHVQ